MARPESRRSSSRRLRGFAFAALAGALSTFLSAVSAEAGDRALLNVLGYSPDGRYFAFEEFGVQDGSGFAYADIYIVDVPADKWMYGSPFHAQAPDMDPERPLKDVRDEALSKAGDKLSEVRITNPAEVLVLLGDGVPDADGKTMSFADPACCGPGSTEDEAYSLTLETYPAKSPNDCEAFLGQPALGFALTLTSPQGIEDEVHRDGAMLPKSRRCPTDYRLYAVVTPFQQSGPRIVLVSSYPFGFEGPDRRFLAVPLDR
jgi:predicted secreted protein